MKKRAVPLVSDKRDFAQTRWSLVLCAGRGAGSDEQAAALETLCRQYWYPLYYFVRREGHSPEVAKDLVQGFFAQILEKNALAQADASRGRFRSFLMASMTNYIANECRRERATKRGGRVVEFLALDEMEAEGRFASEVADERTPDQAFAKRWAETVLECCLAKLRDELDGSGKLRRFDVLKPYLLHDTEGRYRDAAACLGISENAVRSMIHRMRQRFHMVFREEIAHTVSDPREVDEEIRYLLDALIQ